MFFTILPIGFFIAFKLLDFLVPETRTETIELEPVEWKFEKHFRSTDWPLWFYDPSETCVRSMYNDYFVLVDFAISVWKYCVVDYPDLDSPVLKMGLNLTVNVEEGFVEGVRIAFSEDYDPSGVDLVASYPDLDPHFYKLENLTIKYWADYFYHAETMRDVQKAIIEFAGKGCPNKVAFQAKAVNWILMARENMSQQLTIKAEVTYFNRTASVKIVLPILIRLLGDVGNSFETARIITNGNYIANIDYKLDPVDCYKIYLAKGQTIWVSAVLRGLSVNLTLYNPNKELIASISSGEICEYEPKKVDGIVYNIDADGYWYIILSGNRDDGTYLLTIEVK